MHTFKAGQRWVSEMEPELGLGIVLEAGQRTVHIFFAAADCQRQYAIQNAPVQRVRFKPGDTVTTREGIHFLIEDVEENEGLLTYSGASQSIPERDLSDALSFTTPLNRLLNGFIDTNRAFDRRFMTLKARHDLLRSPVHGFIGGRIDLLPHQLYVAHETARRAMPRVLLSDEVGLGKTIEACLILHRLILTGRAHRVLILAPDSLVLQWFVELLRKFNLLFRLIDEDYRQSIVATEPDANPFLMDQLCLVSLDYLCAQESLRRHALSSGWDMIVIDEAHHLSEGSSSYALVRDLGAQSAGLMLLTATPEQLGKRNHFAVLRLLDPDRYPDFETFETETRRYHTIAEAAAKILDARPLNPEENGLVAEIQKGVSPGDGGESRKLVIQNLLDRHGIGRVMFRNTRAVMTGFPPRKVDLVALECPSENQEFLRKELMDDLELDEESPTFDFVRDPRLIWLAGLLKELKQEKVLLICRSQEKVSAIDAALRKHLKVQIAQFHEDLTLIQRDKNAAWFSRKGGAQILLCSEIGSEGRNFQFAHHLVLFDLPPNPELLEQRIGRLDRIGQTETIVIHVPYVRGSLQENLVRWYHEGLDAFEKNVAGAYEILQTLGSDVRTLSQIPGGIDDAFIKKTKTLSSKIAARLEKGRDRILEIHSFDREVAENLIREIRKQDSDPRLERYILEVFDQFGIRVDALNPRTWQVNFDLLDNPAFPIPPLRDENLIVTMDRATACQREDIEFLTWDHPMVTGATDLILGSEKGNCAASLCPDADTEEIVLESIFVLECVAPQKFHLDRFLPPMPIQIIVNHRLEDRSELIADDRWTARLRGAPPAALLANAGIKALIPKMISEAELQAEKRIPDLLEKATKEMEFLLQQELNRLLELRKVNPNVRAEEIAALEEEKTAFHDAIHSARIRLDALRLIFRSAGKEVS